MIDIFIFDERMMRMMKRLLTNLAIFLLLLCIPLSASGATFWPSHETGIDSLWFTVPWEDKGKDVTFGIRCNTFDAKLALADGSIEIDILEKGSAEWNAYFGDLDAQNAKADSLMLMVITLKDSEGNEMSAADLNLTLLVQGQSEWTNKAIKFVCITNSADEAFGLTRIYDPAPSDNVLGEYLSIGMKHFSPFAIYEAPASQPAPLAPPSDVPATGDRSMPMLWAAVSFMGAAALLVLVKRKKA